jgi:ketosteroid isomerase-like protein
MMDLQEISDRLEIQDLIARYCHAIDRLELDELDAIFTEDAVIDYTAFGAPRSGLAEMKRFLAEILAGHASYYHLAAASTITIDGDAAQCHTICHNTLVRTPAGWRIAERVEEKCYLATMPEARLG